MAAIAVHRESGTKYVVLGSVVRMFTPGHGMAGSGQPKAGLESPKAVPVTMMAVCDAEGTIVWFRSDELLVTEIDGVSPGAVLTRAAYR